MKYSKLHLEKDNYIKRHAVIFLTINNQYLSVTATLRKTDGKKN